MNLSPSVNIINWQLYMRILSAKNSRKSISTESMKDYPTKFSVYNYDNSNLVCC